MIGRVAAVEQVDVVVNLGQKNTSSSSSGMVILLAGSISNILARIIFNSGEMGRIVCKKVGSFMNAL